MDFNQFSPYIAAALALSEALALVPGIKANGIIDLVIRILRVLAKKS